MRTGETIISENPEKERGWMEYISVKEAAARWKISERMVQSYCAKGQIEGARKFGGSWEIPSVCKKPGNLRGKKEGSGKQMRQDGADERYGLMPLMNSAFTPGKCREFIEKLEEGPEKQIAWAEYYYFSAQAEKAVKTARPYLESSEAGVRLSACLISAYASLTLGRIDQVRDTLGNFNRMLGKVSPENSPSLCAAQAFVASTAAVLLHLPLPEHLPDVRDCFLMLPPGLRVFALYVRAHHLYLQKAYEKSLGIVEATLALQENVYPIPVIYLHLAAVMDYMSLRQPEQAREHLLAAWKLARPDDLIEGFGEHHGLLGGMLEAVIKKEWPEDFRRIISITYRFSAGWRKIHNPDTGHDVADNLTTTEFAIAMLAARGWTNQEIGEHMNITPNTVKSFISSILQKLSIRNRKELKQFMLR